MCKPHDSCKAEPVFFRRIFGMLISMIEYPRGQKTKGNAWMREYVLINVIVLLSNFYYNSFVLTKNLIVYCLNKGVSIVFDTGDKHWFKIFK